mmetsp:Transcript_16829/g.30101  ORF Transcript_16829/g.30101 Transcript_16829/m.30101 type:complete len:210 (+) Transcript_16829:525-1154(+)
MVICPGTGVVYIGMQFGGWGWGCGECPIFTLLNSFFQGRWRQVEQCIRKACNRGFKKVWGIGVWDSISKTQGGLFSETFSHFGGLRWHTATYTNHQPNQVPTDSQPAPSDNRMVDETQAIGPETQTAQGCGEWWDGGCSSAPNEQCPQRTPRAAAPTPGRVRIATWNRNRAQSRTPVTLTFGSSLAHACPKWPLIPNYLLPGPCTWAYK